MQVFTTSRRIIVTCNKRLSPYLEQETVALGFKTNRLFSSGVELNGTVTDCMKLNMHLRCGSQVLYSLKSFFAADPDELYQQLVTFPWENLITKDTYFSITSNVHHPTIKTDLFANVKVKDAIVDRMRQVNGERPNSGAALDGAVFHLYWNESGAELFIDTSGETLAKHGYRKIPGAAPMLEALASATIMATTWNRTSPFVNPMCGSGTVAIEAALIATNRYPGLYRNNYSFMHITGFEKEVYEKMLEELKAKIISVPDLKIIATDISDDAVDIAEINAGIAGVKDLITFAQCDFTMTEIPDEENGVVFFNPEYGERLGEVDVLAVIYKLIGDFMKKQCGGYTGYVFTGNLDLAKKIGLKPRNRFEFYTSKIDCRLFSYELYAGTKRLPKEEGGEG